MHIKNDMFRQCVSYYEVDNINDFDTDMSETLFTSCVFQNISLNNIDLSGSKFVKCEFVNIKINNMISNPCCEFVECDFINCDIELIQFMQTNFRNCRFIVNNKSR